MDEGLLRSADWLVTFWGWSVWRGIGGLMMSVRMSLLEGSDNKTEASCWPMNPAAPVMRMLGIFEEVLKIDSME